MLWRLQCVIGLAAVLLLESAYATPAWAEAADAPPAKVTAAEPVPVPVPAAPASTPERAIVVDAKLPLAKLLQLAGAAFTESRYDDSIAYLNAAYTRQPLPVLLFNIAQSHRKAGHAQKALELYERFLRENPQSPLAPEASADVEAMRARLAAEQATEAKAEAEQLARERAEQAEQAAKLHEAERLQADAALRKEIARKEQPVYKRKWFWGLLGGLVGTGIVAGIVVGIALRPPAEPAGSLSTQEVHF